MKNTYSTPGHFKKEEKRFHPLRLIVACTLIALLLVSTSIGLSYARYKNVATNSDRVNFLGNDFLHADNVVIAYIDRDDPTNPTVLNFHDDIVVTVPRGLKAEDSSIAYALIVKDYQPVAYDITTGEYKTSATLQLVGLSYPDETSFTFVTVSRKGNNYLDVKLRIENTANTITSGRVGSFDKTPVIATTDDSEIVTYADFADVSSLGTKAASSSAVVSAGYQKTNWIDVADTSWYNPDNPESYYVIHNASELAGLAKLVNGDPENNVEGITFEGVFFKLTDDISMYGSGGEGDIREWTPIGTEDSPFMGSFDCDGHKITGLVISGGIAADNVGLFGVTDALSDFPSVIKNFTLEIPQVYGKNGKNTGTVIGKATSNKVENVTIDSMKISSQGSDAVVGTIVGEANGAFDYFSCTVHTVDSDDFNYIGKDNRNGSVDPTETPTEEPTVPPTQAVATEKYETPIH